MPHTPSLTVNGLTVTIDADIAWFDADAPLPAGDYTLNALGFPDDRKNPVRLPATLTASVSPSRQDLVTLAYAEVIRSRDNLLLAALGLTELNPTREEILAALPTTQT